jgi:hypothetical protein
VVSTLVDTGRCSIVIDVPETLHSQRERGRVTAQGRRTDNTGCMLLCAADVNGTYDVHLFGVGRVHATVWTPINSSTWRVGKTVGGGVGQEQRGLRGTLRRWGQDGAMSDAAPSPNPAVCQLRVVLAGAL